MKKLVDILLLALGLFLFTSSCQTTKKVLKTEGFSSTISQDKLGNVYRISGMEIVKYSSTLDSLKSNSIYSNGTITSLDTRNPMQLMLFFKQQQEIVLLDNTLSQTNKINLQFLEWIDLACMSNRDNAFWLYSKNTQSLIKTDKSGKISSRFKNIGQIIETDINPTQLVEYENEVYLFDPIKGLFVFDLYGNYVKQYFLKDAELIKFSEYQVFYKVRNMIKSLDLLLGDDEVIFESEENFDDFVLNRNGVFIIYSNSIIQKPE